MARQGRNPSAEAVADEPPGGPEQELGEPEAVARAVCLRLLTQRARSRAELASALAKRGVPDDAATRVLDRFAEVGLVDDAALASRLAETQRRERGLARPALAAKLRQRGLGEQVDSALAAIDGADERVRAGELVAGRRRTLAGLPPDVQSRRLVALLARKGYPAGLAYAVVREALGAELDLFAQRS